jgi:hypothetical protein
VGAWLVGEWSDAYCFQVLDLLLEFDEVATFLFDQAGAVDEPQADRTIAARGSFRPGRSRMMLPPPVGLPIACLAG